MLRVLQRRITPACSARRLSSCRSLTATATLAAHIKPQPARLSGRSTPAVFDQARRRNNEAPRFPASLPVSEIVQRQLEQHTGSAALTTFSRRIERKLLAGELRSCLQHFAAYTSHDRPRLFLEAFKIYIDAGYEGQVSDWVNVLRCHHLQLDEFLYLLERSPPPLTESERLAVATIHFFARTAGATQAEAFFANYTEALALKGKHPGPLAYAAIITARGLVGDLSGASKWFEFWRTGKNTHPYGYLENQNRHKHAGRWLERRHTSNSMDQRDRHIVLNDFKTPYDADETSTGAARDGEGRTGATAVQPDPEPYLALLSVLSVNRKLQTFRVVELLATDRVRLSTKVYIALMRHELTWKEATHVETILALYQRMMASNDPLCRPDDHIYALVFKAYREPRKLGETAFNPPNPTRLSRLGNLPRPADDLTDNPRRVFRDMITGHLTNTAGGTAGTGAATATASPKRFGAIYARLLDLALGGFLRARDFEGARVVLSCYSLFKIDCTIRTHATTVSALLRAQYMQHGFRTPEGQSFLDERKRHELKARVEHLQELAGGSRPLLEVDPPPKAKSSRLHSVKPKPESSALVAVRPEDAAEDYASAVYWNDRIVPRTPARVRDTRRFEMRDMEYLKELLYYASVFAGDQEAWRQRPKVVEEEMGVSHYRQIMYSPHRPVRRGNTGKPIAVRSRLSASSVSS